MAAGAGAPGHRAAAFATVTVTEVAPLLPAASRARAVRLYEPLAAAVVSQSTEYGAVVSSTPRGFPPTKNWTPLTPTLSEAVAPTVRAPLTVSPAAGNVMVTVGAVVS